MDAAFLAVFVDYRDVGMVQLRDGEGFLFTASQTIRET